MLPRRAEQVRDEPERRALDVGEQERRTAGRDHAPMDFCDFEIRVDRRVHGDDGGVTAEQVDERAQVREHVL